MRMNYGNDEETRKMKDPENWQFPPSLVVDPHALWLRWEIEIAGTWIQIIRKKYICRVLYRSKHDGEDWRSCTSESSCKGNKVKGGRGKRLHYSILRREKEERIYRDSVTWDCGGLLLSCIFSGCSSPVPWVVLKPVLLRSCRSNKDRAWVSCDEKLSRVSPNIRVRENTSLAKGPKK